MVCLENKQIILSFLRLHPSTAFKTLLLTMMATPFLLKDSCPSSRYIVDILGSLVKINLTKSHGALDSIENSGKASQRW